MPNGSDVANLSVLGYDPRKCLQGRGVLEAASMGIDLEPTDVAMRCNLLTLNADGTLKNHSAGHISNEEAAILIRDLDAELGAAKGDQPLVFHPGVSYRHLLVMKGGWADPAVDCAPPHDHIGEPESALLPKARTAAAESTASRLLELHARAKSFLAQHPVNLARIAAGKDPANAIWNWSPGRRPQMEPLTTRFGITGGVISAVDLIHGIGRYAGLDRIHVDGATGLSDTNYEGKAQAALLCLETRDFVFVHVEATDEASHSRDLDLKLKCIEYLDARIVAPILEGIEARGWKATVAVLPDHPTEVETGNHASDPVPFALWRPGIQADASTSYDEAQALASGLLLKEDEFIKAVFQA
jgi:2,3-bisphosphoglycerate-independent phosphoglycerate mutase